MRRSYRFGMVSRSCVTGRWSFRCEFGAGDLDLIPGIAHGVRRLHGRFRRRRSSRTGPRRARRGGGRGCPASSATLMRLVGGPVDRGGDLGAFEAVEAHDEAGERRVDVGGVAPLLERFDGRVVEHERPVDVTMDRFDTGGVAGDVRLPEGESMVSGVDEALTECIQRQTWRVGRVRPPERVQRMPDQERVGVGTGGGQGLLGESAMASSVRPSIASNWVCRQRP